MKLMHEKMNFKKQLCISCVSIIPYTFADYLIQTYKLVSSGKQLLDSLF